MSICSRVAPTARRRRGAPQGRRGTAVTELAVLLPPLVVLVFATLECTSMIFLKQTATICAYEAARRMAHPEGDEASGLARVQQVATSRGVANVTTSFTPTGDLARGTEFTCQVSIPSGANAILPPWFFGGKTLEGRVTMVKE